MHLPLTAGADIEHLEEPPMMNAILMAVVQFLETVVNWAIGAVLIALAVIGMIAVCQWIVSRSGADGSFGRTVGVLRKGSGSLALAVVLAVGLLLAGVALMTR